MHITRDLAGHVVVAAVQLAADQDAGADAGADEDEGAGVVAARGARASARRGSPGSRRSRPAPAPGARDSSRSRIGTCVQPCRLGAEVTRPRSRSTAPGAPAPTATRREAGTPVSSISARRALRDAREQERRRPEPLRRRHDAVGEALAAQVGERQARARRPEVDARDVAVARVELHERRAPAAARRSRAEVAHDADLHQLRDERAHGRRGQAGGADQLGAGERAVVLHGDGQHASRGSARAGGPHCGRGRRRVAARPMAAVPFEWLREGSLRKSRPELAKQRPLTFTRGHRTGDAREPPHASSAKDSKVA